MGTSGELASRMTGWGLRACRARAQTDREATQHPDALHLCLAFPQGSHPCPTGSKSIEMQESQPHCCPGATLAVWWPLISIPTSIFCGLDSIYSVTFKLQGLTIIRLPLWVGWGMEDWLITPELVPCIWMAGRPFHLKGRRPQYSCELRVLQVLRKSLEALERESQLGPELCKRPCMLHVYREGLALVVGFWVNCRKILK